MIAWNWSYVDPYMAFDLAVSFDMLVMAMFGGVGTVAGPVLGAVIMSVVKEASVDELPAISPDHLRRAACCAADHVVPGRHHPGRSMSVAEPIVTGPAAPAAEGRRST